MGRSNSTVSASQCARSTGIRTQVAEMILNSATLKGSYANYEKDARELGLVK